MFDISFVLDVLKLTGALLVLPGSILAFLAIQKVRDWIDHYRILEFPAPARYYTLERQAEVRIKRTQLAVHAANNACSGINPIGSATEHGWKAWLHSKFHRSVDSAEWRYKRAIEVSNPFMRPV